MDRDQARRIALRTAYRSALSLMTEEQRAVLLDTLAGTEADLGRSWEPATDSQQDILNGLKVEQLILRSLKDELRRQRDPSEPRDLYLVCAACDTTLINAGIENVCPSCGNADWLEAFFV